MNLIFIALPRRPGLGECCRRPSRSHLRAVAGVSSGKPDGYRSLDTTLYCLPGYQFHYPRFNYPCSVYFIFLLPWLLFMYKLLVLDEYTRFCSYSHKMEHSTGTREGRESDGERGEWARHGCRKR